MTIGLYPGSFNPFHRGHYNIALKAEKIFDKIIIAKGVNPDKPVSKWHIPSLIKDRYIVTKYYGLLTDCVDSIVKAYPKDKVTVIRGLRNSVDLQYEMNQYRYLQELMPSIQMVSIFCDKEYEHISSSGIRTLGEYGDDKIKRYLIYDLNKNSI